MLIYGFLTVFAVLFFIYFFMQASNNNLESVTSVPISGQSDNLIGGSIKIDSDLFNSDKFRNLRFDKMPAAIFPVGKRDPFVPIE